MRQDTRNTLTGIAMILAAIVVVVMLQCNFGPNSNKWQSNKTECVVQEGEL